MTFDIVCRLKIRAIVGWFLIFCILRQVSCPVNNVLVYLAGFASFSRSRPSLSSNKYKEAS